MATCQLHVLVRGHIKACDALLTPGLSSCHSPFSAPQMRACIIRSYRVLLCWNMVASQLQWSFTGPLFNSTLGKPQAIPDATSDNHVFTLGHVRHVVILI
jgi:hypothetical protein